MEMAPSPAATQRSPDELAKVRKMGVGRREAVAMTWRVRWLMRVTSSWAMARCLPLRDHEVMVRAKSTVLRSRWEEIENTAMEVGSATNTWWLVATRAWTVTLVRMISDIVILPLMLAEEEEEEPSEDDALMGSTMGSDI